MKKTNWTYLVALVVTLSVAAAGCAKKEQAEAADNDTAPTPAEAPSAAADAGEVASAVARLELGADRVDAGMIMFSQESDGVKIVAHIVGAPPGTHGLHIHEIGDCSSDDFKSAGGHFNPTAAAHGAPEDAERHAGDLGNIEIGDDGSGHLELMSDMLSLGEGENSVIGRGVILHAKADDLVSQPTGAAGARLACGVVVAEEGV